MPTNIKTIQNDSTESVIAYNSENVENSFWVKQNETYDPKLGLWISWHENQPLILRTKKGLCHIWDKDWKIHGLWEDESEEIIFLNGKEQGVGGNTKVTIASEGSISMKKAAT